MQPKQAESLAFQALEWMAGRRETLVSFLTASGLEVGDLASVATEPAFATAVLDFLLGDERLVTAFCESAGLRPEAPLEARAALPGGAEVHWT